MTLGEFLTKATVWLAVLAYGVGSAVLLWSRRGEPWPAGARKVWTAGCAFFLAHVGCAFAFYHHWSHAAAYEETARQTQAMTGWNSGAGLYWNYAFAGMWLAEVSGWWLAPEALRRRPAWLVGCWHGFYAFMIFNGTVVFGRGPVRWLGVLVFLCLAVVWWRSARRGRRLVISGNQPF